jgi:4-amino-4-deoxy-L-arabinose transferase-like glycosyltransferase
MNQTGYHDWGGDFAQYIQQAKNIAEGEEPAKSHYVFNPDYELLGPLSYPPGFPLMLSPVYAVWGNSIKPFTVFISVCLFICGILTFSLFRINFGVLTSIIGALVFVYNPWLLRFKSQVLSDIPFAMVSLAILLLHLKLKSRNGVKGLLIGMGVGFAMSLKSIGFALAVAMFLEAVVSKQFRSSWRYVLSVVMGSVISYLVINELVFPAPEDPYSFFLGTLGISNLWTLITDHLTYFSKVLQYFFHPERIDYEFIGVWLESAALVFLGIGMVHSVIEKRTAVVFYFILFISGLLVFPYSNRGGLRYLLPILPVILFLIAVGVRRISRVNTKLSLALKFLIIIAFFTMYRAEFKRIYFTPHAYEGPQYPQSQEVFNFVKSETPETSVILFTKPRVLGLYGERDSWSPDPNHSVQQVQNSIQDLGGDYILKINSLENPAIDSAVIRIGESNPVFSNDNFSLYRITQ